VELLLLLLFFWCVFHLLRIRLMWQNIFLFFISFYFYNLECTAVIVIAQQLILKFFGFCFTYSVVKEDQLNENNKFYVFRFYRKYLWQSLILSLGHNLTFINVIRIANIFFYFSYRLLKTIDFWLVFFFLCVLY